MNTSDERMTQCLEWSQPFGLIKVKNLLNEVNELIYLEIIFIRVVKHKWSETIIPIITCTLSL